VTADENSAVMTDGECVGDRESQASSTDLNELTNAALVLEAEDREGALTEDDEPDTRVKPSLRLAVRYVSIKYLLL